MSFLQYSGRDEDDLVRKIDKLLALIDSGRPRSMRNTILYVTIEEFNVDSKAEYTA